MNFDSTSFPYSLNNVPDEVVARFVNFRLETPQPGPPGSPQHDALPVPGVNAGNQSVQATVHQGMPQPAPSQPTPVPVMRQISPTTSQTDTSVPGMALQSPMSRTRSSPMSLPVASPSQPHGRHASILAQTHSEPQLRCIARVPVDCESSDSDDLPDDEGTSEDFIGSLIRMARHSDRPENEDAWEEAMPAIARALLKYAFQPSSAGTAIIAEVSALLASGHDVCETDPRYGRSVLHWVCLLGDALIVELVLRHGGQRCVNDPDLGGQLPLALLCTLRTTTARRHTLPDASGIATTLLTYGARVRDLPHKGGELLLLPDLTVALASTLVSMGVDIEARGAGAGLGTPLVAACWRGNWQLAAWLIQAGADVRATGRLRCSPLHFGAMPEGLARQLIARGSNPNARDMIGQTPLMCACEAGNLPLARLLVQAGAWVTATDHAGRSVLEIAKSSTDDILQLIREALMLQPGVQLAHS